MDRSSKKTDFFLFESRVGRTIRKIIVKISSSLTVSVVQCFAQTEDTVGKSCSSVQAHFVSDTSEHISMVFGTEGFLC
jgi:hypothetical protein